MMSLPLRISGHRIPLSQQQGFSTFSPASISRVSSRFCSLVPTIFSPEPNKFQRLCYTNANGNVRLMISRMFRTALLTTRVRGITKEVSKESLSHPTRISLEDILRLMKRLRRYGISGILSYGLLNTIYYLTTFLFVWFYVAPAPARMGYGAAVGRFLKITAMVWAGSQVTKLVRAGGALALAPFVDRGLSWFTTKFKFESQWKAFMAIVAFCFGLAIMLFFVVTLLWA